MMDYKEYHLRSLEAGDVDPAIACMKYLAERFELNDEQRYWLAFLYGTCYCGPTVFFMYNEFPDYQTVDLERVQRWWDKSKTALVFQTDRLRIKTADKFVETLASYRAVAQDNQGAYFSDGLRRTDGDWNYTLLYQKSCAIKNFGRFTAFNHLDTINSLTPTEVKPTTLRMADAESCRNGLAFAIGREDLVTHGSDRKLTPNEMNYLQSKFNEVNEANEGSVFQTETTLCAYKKYRLGKRHVGFYIERLRQEILTIEKRVPSGVDWSVLWDFRNETFERKWLKEH